MMWRRARARLALAVIAGASMSAAAGAQDTTRLRISVVGQAALVRTARIGAVAPERSVGLRGLDAEFWVRARGRGVSGTATREGLGFAVRLHQSPLGGDLRYQDVSALYGFGGLIERVSNAKLREAVGDLSAELAVGGMAGYELATGELHGEMHSLARVGVRSVSRVMQTPLSFELRLSRFLAIGGPDGADALSGLDGETALRWSFERWPVDVALGYRLGRLRVYRTAQEVSATRLEIGWRGFP